MEKSAKGSFKIDHLSPTLSKKRILAKTTESSDESENAKGSGILYSAKKFSRCEYLMNIK